MTDETISYKGYNITPAPEHEPDGFLIVAIIEARTDRGKKYRGSWRTDIHVSTEEEAIYRSIEFAKQLINEGRIPHGPIEEGRD